MHSTVTCLGDVKVPLMLERAKLTLWQALIEGQHHPHLQHSRGSLLTSKCSFHMATCTATAISHQPRRDALPA